MEHRVKYVGSAVHPHIRDRMVYLYRCEDCNKPFARSMQGAFMAGECDYVQPAQPDTDAELALKLLSAALLVESPRTRALMRDAAKRLQSAPVKPEGDYMEGGFGTTYDEATEMYKHFRSSRASSRAKVNEWGSYFYGGFATGGYANGTPGAKVGEQPNDQGEQHSNELLKAFLKKQPKEPKEPKSQSTKPYYRRERF